MTFFKNLFKLLNFLLSLIKFKIFNIVNTENEFKFFQKLFFKSGGNSIYLINLILKKSKKKFINNNDFFNVDLNNFDNQKKIKEEGYLFLNNVFSNKFIENLKNKIEKCDGMYKGDNLEKNRFIDKLNKEQPLNTKYSYNSNSLIKIEEIQKIVTDQNLLNFVQEYLGSFPVIDIVTSWWSFPSEKPDANAAQYWHFDLDRPKWLKVFIFLTDVSEKNGPHEFISKSHRAKGIPNNIRTRGYKRVDDLLINETFKDSQKIKFIGNKGSVLFEDTIGMHKGNKVIEKNRLVLQIQYSSSLFGAKSNKITTPKNLIPEFIYTKKNYPYLFQNFD